MSMSDGSSGSGRGGLSIQSLLGPQIYNILALCSNLAFGAAAIGALWLLASLIFGHYGEFATASKAVQQSALNNINLASTLLKLGLGVGSVLALLVYFGEEIIGYLLVGGALMVGLGIPYGFQQFGGDSFATGKSIALAKVYSGFFTAVYFPAAIGGLLIAYDVISRLIRAVRERPTVAVEKMTYGTGAAKESGIPPRTSILGKCWEGPYCREFIRTHCPIFLKRQACWKQRVGCYCEEDIVAAAVSKVTGPTLPMAGSGGASRFGNTPPPANNFNSAPAPTDIGFTVIGSDSRAGMTGMASSSGLTPPPPPNNAPTKPRKVELNNWQKAERCRNCVIYNEHQREKYQVLLPVTLIGAVVLCGFLAIQFHGNMGAVVTGLETLINRFSFLPGTSKLNIGDSSSGVAWALIVAGTIMVLSKVLQLLEWCIFKIKI